LKLMLNIPDSWVKWGVIDTSTPDKVLCLQ
jgi:hypothetical protein